jgi:hypothetical protein
MTDRIEIDKETLQALFDMVVGSLNFESGFYDKEEVDSIVAVARLLGVSDVTAIPPEHKMTYPHLWHQDCELPWRCNAPQDAEIHHPELPK